VTSSAGSAQSSAATPRCGHDDLAFTVSADPQNDPGKEQWDLLLSVENKSGHSCTLKGMPAVVLHGPDDPAFGPDYQIASQPSDTPLATLVPGGSSNARSAFSKLTYLRVKGGGWKPATITFTLPGDSRSYTAPWPDWDTDGVQRQDAATHPGTYVGPIQPWGR